MHRNFPETNSTSRCTLMQAKRCTPAFGDGPSGDLAAGTVSHQSKFLAARLNGPGNRPKMSGNLANVGQKKGATGPPF
jgi:hypothetical protein